MVCQRCQINWLNHMHLKSAIDLQKKLARQRAANKIDNILLLLEHPHVYSLSLNGYPEYLRLNQNDLLHLKAKTQTVNRNGPPVFYHGPGQIAVYPILNLREQGYSYHDYLQLLEKVVIYTLSSFNIRGFREPGSTGISVLLNHTQTDWLYSNRDTAIIAAIGVNIDENHITQHGFFLNVSPNLSYFDLIIASGSKACHFTSMEAYLNRSVVIEDVINALVQAFGQVFKLDMQYNSLSLDFQPALKNPIRKTP